MKQIILDNVLNNLRLLRDLNFLHQEDVKDAMNFLDSRLKVFKPKVKEEFVVKPSRTIYVGFDYHDKDVKEEFLR